MARAQAVAAAEQAGVQVFDGLLKLPLAEFKIQLPVGQYSDIQGFCKHVGISAKGSKIELEARLLEHKNKLDAGEADLPKTPERQGGGRARSPKHGAAAAAVRASLESDEVSSTQAAQVTAAVAASELAHHARAAAAGLAPDAAPAPTTGPSQPTIAGAAVPPPGVTIEMIEEMAVDAAGDMDPLTKDDPWGKASSSSTGLPGGVPLLGVPLVVPPPGAPRGPHGLPSAAHAGSFDTPVSEAKNRSDSARTALRSLVGPREVPKMPGAEPNAEPTNADIMSKLDQQAELMTALLGAVALKEDVRAAQLETMEATKALIQSEVQPVNTTVTELSMASVIHDDRIGKLESQFEVMQGAIPDLDLSRPRADWTKDAADPMYRSVGFFGWEDSDDVIARREKVSQYMEAHFPKIAYAVGFEYKFPRKDGKLKTSCHVTMITRDEADTVVKEINSRKYKIFNGKGKELKVDKPRSALQKARWAAVKRAETQLKKDERCRNLEVKVDPTMPVRRVFVNGVAAFEQTKDDAIGVFVGAFAGTVLKDR